MSDLTIVRQSLEANPAIVIGKVYERNYLPNRNGFWSHTVDFHLAPKVGLFTADELQTFMMGLVPEGLKPSSVDEFSQYAGGGELRFGKLYFDEEIGGESVTRVCELDDKELLNAKGFVDGKRTITSFEPYKRRTWVRLFPSEPLLRDILRGHLDADYWISLRELERYKPHVSFLQRLMGKK